MCDDDHVVCGVGSQEPKSVHLLSLRTCSTNIQIYKETLYTMNSVLTFAYCYCPLGFCPILFPLLKIKCNPSSKGISSLYCMCSCHIRFLTNIPPKLGFIWVLLGSFVIFTKNTHHTEVIIISSEKCISWYLTCLRMV